MAMQITPATSWIHGARFDVEVWTLGVATAPAVVDVSPSGAAERSGRLAEGMLYSPRRKICVPYIVKSDLFCVCRRRQIVPKLPAVLANLLSFTLRVCPADWFIEKITKTLF